MLALSAKSFLQRHDWRRTPKRGHIQPQRLGRCEERMLASHVDPTAPIRKTPIKLLFALTTGLDSATNRNSKQAMSVRSVRPNSASTTAQAAITFRGHPSA